MSSPTPSLPMAAPKPDEILRALADPERLAIAGLLARGPRTASALAAELQAPVPKVRRHLARLARAGVAGVDADRRTYLLQFEALRGAALEVGPPRDTGLALGAMKEEEAAVLRRHFRGGRLVDIPVKQSRRRIVLERLALEFDVGVRYPEREVNETLKRFHEDYAAIRRYLVDEGFLSRESGQYWRSGGQVDV